jgi:hypothetical protein
MCYSGHCNSRHVINVCAQDRSHCTTQSRCSKLYYALQPYGNITAVQFRQLFYCFHRALETHVEQLKYQYNRYQKCSLSHQFYIPLTWVPKIKLKYELYNSLKPEPNERREEKVGSSERDYIWRGETEITLWLCRFPSSARSSWWQKYARLNNI